MMYKPHSTIHIKLHFGDSIIDVGKLVRSENTIYFEYDTDILDKNLHISPIKLPLQTGLTVLPQQPFEGLAGVFNDSLPDGWGRLLFDRHMRSLYGLIPQQITALDRLIHTGNRGLGALVYKPDYSDWQVTDTISLDTLSEQSHMILQGQASDILQQLLALNGSSAGARPKALIGVNADFSDIVFGDTYDTKTHSPWMVKFTNTHDGLDAGAIEYVYAIMAKNAGLNMPKTHLFDTKLGAGYFAVQRFDTDGITRYHKHTACGLLHADFRVPMLDYNELIKLSLHLTQDIRQAEKIFQMAVFNVLSHNQDDHGKNFSFLMDKHGNWWVSPAYDVTYAHGLNSEQSTTVMGLGKNIGKDSLIKLGEFASISPQTILDTIDKTCQSLSDWYTLAKNYGVGADNIKIIGDAIDKNIAL